jgi:3-oxoacyl-[acyl-carrier protein] reductase
MINYNLSGKNVLVSGGSHGIGREVCLSLAKEGCGVYFFGRTSENLLNTISELNQITKLAKGYYCDVLLHGSIAGLLHNLKKDGIEIDILINNVGGGGRWGSSFLDTTITTWDEVYRKNMGAAIELTKAFLPNMINKKWGRVLTVSSVLGRESFEDSKPWFVVTKSAEIAFMKSLSKKQEYVSNNITFNTVCPGATYIPGTGWDKLGKEELESFTSKLPRRKMLDVFEVTNTIVFLCSDLASGINGSCIVVDGGESSSI